MQTFKRTPMNMVKNLFYGIIGPVALAVVAYIVLSIFFPKIGSNNMALIAIAAIALLIMAYFIYDAIIGKNIRIEIDNTELRYYKHNQLKGTYKLADYSFGYRTVSQGSTTDTINLRMMNLQTGEETVLDCEALGPNQFHKMFALLETTESANTEVIDADVKEV